MFHFFILSVNVSFLSVFDTINKVLIQSFNHETHEMARKLFQHKETEIQRIKKLTGNYMGHYMAIIC